MKDTKRREPTAEEQKEWDQMIAEVRSLNVARSTGDLQDWTGSPSFHLAPEKK